MISLHTLFWIMVIFFGIIGMLRGWTKEVVATAGLVLSLFAQLWFGHILVAFFSEGAAAEARKLQFIVRTVAHIAFAFFAYQGPTLARQVTGGKLGDRARSGIQESLLGFVVGAINGYLVVGSIWCFLEYNIVDKVVTPWNMAYPFPESILSRPLEGTVAFAMMSKLPLPLLQGWLPLLLVVLFLFVIVALI